MAFAKQKNREVIFQTLYALDYSVSDKTDLIKLLMELIKTTKKNIKSLFELVEDIRSKQDEIDEIIKNISKSYNFNRISKVELNIIRQCIYEIKYIKDLPAKVSIAEAIRLCKKFSTKEGANFVNAIVDGFYQSYEHTKQHIS
ncbi:MAG: hypothetical protein K1060chlam5_00316 [Candidatus Anoxychlamydiales bacterium]|nr:hypothetical protein [Candidatus Anoxychlamydiales bacterium]